MWTLPSRCFCCLCTTQLLIHLDLKMAESRLRKRSTRLSESDPLAVPTKKTRKRDAPAPAAVGRPRKGFPRRHRGESSSTPPTKPSSVSGRGGCSLREVRRGKRLLVSLKIQDNNLQVSRQPTQCPHELQSPRQSSPVPSPHGQVGVV